MAVLPTGTKAVFMSVLHGSKDGERPGLRDRSAGVVKDVGASKLESVIREEFFGDHNDHEVAKDAHIWGADTVGLAIADCHQVSVRLVPPASDGMSLFTNAGCQGAIHNQSRTKKRARQCLQSGTYESDGPRPRQVVTCSRYSASLKDPNRDQRMATLLAKTIIFVYTGR